MINRNAQKIYQSTFRREFFIIHHTPPRKNSEMGRNLLMFRKFIQIVKKITVVYFKWEKFVPFHIFPRWCMMKPSRLKFLWYIFERFYWSYLHYLLGKWTFFKKVEPMLRAIFKPNPYINCLTCQIWANFAPFQIFS